MDKRKVIILKLEDFLVMNKRQQTVELTKDELEEWAEIIGLVQPENEYVDLCGIWALNPHYLSQELISGDYDE